MPINYPGVSLATNLYPSNVNAQIAQGADLSFIGQLPDAYFKGSEEAYKTRNRNLFQQGLPKDAAGNVDWNMVSEQLARAGGAPAIQNVIGLRSLDVAANLPPPPDLYGSAGAAGGPSQAALPPSTQGGAKPMAPPAAAAVTPGAQPQTTDQELTPAQIAAANPQGVPAAVTRPTPAAQVQARFPQPTSPAAPPAAPAEQPGGVQVAQAQQPAAVPYGQPDPMEVNATRAGDYYARQAEALGFNPNTKAASQAARAQADKYYGIAQQLREQRLKASLGTTEMQNARAAGAASPIEYERTQQLQKNAITRGEKLYDGIQAAASQYETDLKQYNSVARSILNDPRAYTGIGAEAVLDINKVRALWGDRNPAQLQEMLEKVRAASVLAQINVQKDQMQQAGANSSRIFSTQVDQVAKASPGLENTLAGNRALINIQTKMGELQTEIARQARVYRQQHGYLDDGFDQQISDYLKNNPVFSKQEQAHPAWLGAPDAPAGLTPMAAVTWAARMGLQPGDVVRTPSGYAKVPRLTIPLNPSNVQQ